MKTAIATLILLFSFVSFAYPAINDSVTYNGKYTFTEANFTVGFIQESAITGENKEAGKMTVHNALYLPDSSVQEEDQEVSLTELKTQAQVLQLLQNCAAAGGKSETIEVVGGTFATCHLTSESAEIWIGDVPFAIVKQITKDDKGNFMELEIALYTVGE
jgi:hypothetical protein